MFRIINSCKLLKNQSRLIARSFALKPNSNFKTKISRLLYAIGTGCTLTVLYQLRTVYQKPVALPLEGGTLRQQFNFIDKVVQKCSPSVVYITIQNANRIDPQTGQPQTLSNGSGFLVDENGWILTNAHVVIGKPNNIVSVMMSDGSTYEASVENADMNIDLALLRIHAKKKLPYLPLGSSKDVTTGEWVVALGSPLSLSHSVTAGIVSSVDRRADELGMRNSSMRYIQTDATTTFGNSGGPLVDLDGKVIGINNLRVTAGISFAIPVDYAKRFLDGSKSILQPVPVNYQGNKAVFLGIVPMFITPQVLTTLGQHQTIPESLTSGILVWKVIRGAPAYVAGLQQGDIITRINDVNVSEVYDIYRFIKGDIRTLSISVIRNGSEVKIKLDVP
ncbi:hypothetical protein PPYR_10344 [Photinus pyralis]|uniref:Serine protease HTRA2, mitochondrial n=1 Tax=Photinus pyralis TaxID=7054 RepID=A0A1Y1LQ79_PHOPY|nr:serine protease HTRA2, mitochondrial-like [Photinus pyralis]XP_031347727.1 serine protease HTRA2, mitochondrial-like [Photinus pyralis]XP_031347729.1 serine protease HTRA2, mitochondrial-like [Photinus pyralis]XP_031347730.1 serine protease HTRA2, mitochondrial-like [Photinus pyralis]XP_031347731.1 serine protease HTRA2, mitochondrial-like [Photinus pyralis]XP_031347732.1 serine protease HTRA2, mitochondrial-like [Photinus pyralis]KAB0796283.1 hypothetical protein PPYR_10344 [Photinus pyra